MRLVERDLQTTRIAESLSASAAGRGQAVLLVGALASGKTGLLNWTAERAAQRGGIVLRATCSRAEQALPFGVADQLLRSAALSDEVIRTAGQWLDRATIEAATGDGGTGTLGPGTAAALRGLSLVMLRLAEATAVTICVDDVHWSDTFSLNWLLHLVRRIGSATVMVVLTENPSLSARDLTFRTDLLDQPCSSQLSVDLLSAAGVRELLADSVDRQVAAELGPEVAALSGGNPLLAKALIAERVCGRGPGSETYGRAVMAQLHRSSAPWVLRTAQALAVLDDDASPGRLSRLAQLDCHQVKQALHVMTEGGLLAGGLFRHSAARTTVLADLPAEARATLYVAAAVMLHEQGEGPTRIARLLVAANRPPPPWAVTVLLEAADADVSQGRSGSASSALDLARRGASDRREQAAITARLVQALWRTSPATARHHLEPLTYAATAGQLDQRPCVRLVNQLLWHGLADPAREVLATVRRAAADASDEVEPELEDLDAWLAWTHPSLVDGESAVDRGEDSTRPIGLLVGFLRAGRSREAVASAEQMLRDHWSGRWTALADEASLLSLNVLASAGRADLAAAWCDRLLAKARSEHSTTWRAQLSATRAEIAIHQGDLPAAAEHGRSALNRLTPRSWGLMIGLPLGCLVLTETRMGCVDKAAEYLARPVPDGMLKCRYGLIYRYARGHYYLAAGSPHAALDEFMACGRVARSWVIDVPGIVPWRAGAAEALQALGAMDRAKRILGPELAQPDQGAVPVNRGLALRLLSKGLPPERRVQQLGEAFELLQNCGNQYEQVQTLMDLSGAYQDLGDGKQARVHARRARRMAGTCGAAPLSQALLALSDGVATPPRIDAGGIWASRALTESEGRVAALAVQGHTNREIAAKLYIATSTVEQHLTRVYQKLGVKGRRDLPTKVASTMVRELAIVKNCG